MSLPFIADKTFEKKDYRKESLTKAEYDNCIFINCDFTDSYLSAVSFTDCQFKDCNLSGIKVKDATFKDVLFSHCKLLGINFYECSDFLFSFEAHHSLFSFSSFFNKNLNQTRFSHCVLEKVDFTNANLSKSCFDHSDLKHATFDNTNLKKADLVTATNFNINPENNVIEYAKFSKEGALTLLNAFKVIIE
ncbi:pentapeptide repeat-containing protein [Hanstruepera flava]|uniref:pentapeptide repeat-containing protein n=1 Tax=Hanstruepera flava TaxID=2930218 RepID=UPI0020294448|nr:pentapeptide repeat-containing protein [Hanstruepera flava]